MLTSNTVLKNSICSEDNEVRKMTGHKMYTSSNLARFGDTPYEIYVMSYSEFGSKIRILRNQGYIIEDKLVTLDGKRTRISIITK